MTTTPEQPAPLSVEDGRTLAELWAMLDDVTTNSFLGYQTRWGEPFPSGAHPQAHATIRLRIEAAVKREALEGTKEHDYAMALDDERRLRRAVTTERDALRDRLASIADYEPNISGDADFATLKAIAQEALSPGNYCPMTAPQLDGDCITCGHGEAAHGTSRYCYECPEGDEVIALHEYKEALKKQYEALTLAIEDEHETWHKVWSGEGRNGVAPPITECRNPVCVRVSASPG